MKHFWVYCTIFILLWLGVSYIGLIGSAHKESFVVGETIEKQNYQVGNFPDYHDTEDEIREKNKLKMNVFYIRGKNGKPVAINMASTQTLPTYYNPEEFPYGASNFVPTYEDTILLTSRKSLEIP